jgi:TonB family protein
MNTIIIYITKASLYMAAFYIVYALFLSKDTMYVRNRAFVLISVISSLILPFITIRTAESFSIPVFSKILSDIFINGTSGGSGLTTPGDAGISWLWIVFKVYLTGVIILGLKLIIDLAELILLISNNKRRGSNIIRFRGFNTSGFSAFGYVFVNIRLAHEEAKEIIIHEQIHLDHYHSVDIILIEITKVFMWFNPFIYLFSRSLRTVHEYQADEGCLNMGVPVDNYQRLLLNQIFKSKVFTATNSFTNPTLIKKRMIMMTKKRSKAMANLKLLMVLPVIAAVMFIISSCNQSNKTAENSIEVAPPPPPPPPPPPVGDISSDTPLESADEMPVFKGGDAALLDFIVKNTKYPEVAKTKGIQGKIIVRFAVEADGSVDKVSILKGVDPELDQEALRVVNSLPDFEKPGIKDTKNVAVWYMIPINFALK